METLSQHTHSYCSYGKEVIDLFSIQWIKRGRRSDCVNDPGVSLNKSEAVTAMQKNAIVFISFLLLHLSVHCHFDINVTIDCIIMTYFIVVAQEIGDHIQWLPWTSNICTSLVDTLCRP